MTGVDAIREAAEALRARGINHADEVLRVGAAAMVQQSVDVFDQRSDVGPGWLAQIVRNGGPRAQATPARVKSVDEFLARWEERYGR